MDAGSKPSGFLPKPFRLQDLREAIEKALGHGR